MRNVSHTRQESPGFSREEEVKLATIAFGGMATAIVFGIYSFGTWLFTFGRTFGVVSVCALIVALLVVAVKIRLSINR